MKGGEITVSISASSESSAMAIGIKETLTAKGCHVLVDMPPSTGSTASWGIDHSTIIDSVFGDTPLYCILLLDRQYSKDKFLITAGQSCWTLYSGNGGLSYPSRWVIIQLKFTASLII